ncbi:MAG: hypothetical protein IJ727_02555 [Treponema sp.]|nr:hypothetical protein [Treponema sp.]
MSDILWSKVIAESFFYTEFHSYNIEKISEGIVLHAWSKNYDNTAYSEGSLFLKPEWIIHLINLIRSVSKNVLDRGDGPEGTYGGEWERSIEIPADDLEKYEISLYAKNKYYERSSPKLEIRIIVTNPKVSDKFSNEYFPDYPLLKKREAIGIKHRYDVEAYIRDIEPVLHELEKYVPEKDKSKILEPIGKIKTELEEKFEWYLEKCRKDKDIIKIPEIRWIKKQVGDKDYEVTLVIFYDEKIDCQKTIKCTAKEMAMASKYFSGWALDIKTLPYTKSNQFIKLEISESSRYKKHKNVKLLIKSKNDFFEVPFMYDKEIMNPSRHPFYDFINFTEAEKIHLHYPRKLHAFFIDEYFALKWNTDEVTQIDEEHSRRFYVSLYDLIQFYHVLMYIQSIEKDKKGIEALKYKKAGPFRFWYSEDENEGTIYFSITNEDVHNSYNNRIDFTCFPEEFAQEFEKIYMLVEANFIRYSFEHPGFGIKTDFKRIKWNNLYISENKSYFLTWTYADEEKKHEVKLSKEKIYKIQEYAFWWWRATKHNKELILEDKKIYFKINPKSDNPKLGQIILKFKKKPKADVTAYFDLSTGCNLPKDFCSCQYNEIVRRVQLDIDPDLTDRIPDYNREDFKSKSDYVCFNYWDSKYNVYDQTTQHFFALDKAEFSDFLESIKELYEFLGNTKNKISALLDKEVEKKYDREGYSISIYRKGLDTDKADITIDDDLPLYFIISSRCRIIRCDWLSMVGTRQILLSQFKELLTALESSDVADYLMEKEKTEKNE